MERRQNQRAATNLRLNGRVPASPVLTEVLDLSPGGCRVRAASPLLKRGATILLSIAETTEIAGQIVWQQGREFGVQFHEELSEEALAQLQTGCGDSSPFNQVGRDRFGRRMLPLRSWITVRPM